MTTKAQHTNMKEEKGYSEAFKEGVEAVSLKPEHAPVCPYDEDREPDAHNGWTDGAIEAGIGELYTNGALNK
jgi:hypothetical protein